MVIGGRRVLLGYALCLFFWDWDFLDILTTVTLLLSRLGIRGEADTLSDRCQAKSSGGKSEER